ncbi:hypothetical protein M8C21_014306 [Ambrosia artemisiifolia]|uniref:Trafficking protein particle complex subunit 13 middle domain-containing protein n=1 Tax=Ambrosia artemisiifolia TaxID=4212 RepID=A0AAD5CM10_AMBAR|nr:hypothetical protein M8C21_014306 [Ambrosia artemisiifolia]
MLLDTSKSPLESIRAGGRYDFIVEHDVKELGAHTALYNDGDAERKYLPQYFKFMVSNPLSIRTKVRVVKDTTYLETCLENNTKSNLFMGQVEFRPAPRWSAIRLKADVHHSEKGAFTRRRNLQYLYALKMSCESTKGEGTRHVEIKEIDLKAVKVPSVIILEKPFMVQLSLTNLTGKKLGPFEVWLSLTDSKEEKAIMLSGFQRMDLHMVEAFASLEFQLNLISTKLDCRKSLVLHCLIRWRKKPMTRYLI